MKVSRREDDISLAEDDLTIAFLALPEIESSYWTDGKFRHDTIIPDIDVAKRALGMHT